MALILADRVRDTTTTTGTGTVTLSGTAPTGYQNFSVIGNGNTTYYTINAGSQWEVGIGTYSSTGPTLSRDTVLESSNANALVDFAAGIKDVFVTYPSEKAVTTDGVETLTNKTINGSNNTITNVSLTTGVTGTLPVANGGTGATDAITARSNLSVPSTTGSGASGTWSINVTGNAGTVSSITSGQVTTALGYTPANRAGDTFTGNVTILPPAGWSTGNTAYLYLGDTNNGISSTFGNPTNVFGFHGVTFSAQGSQLGSFDTSGNGYASASFRAPIFYDSNDTGRYLDPAGTSLLGAAYFNNVALDPSNIGAGVAVGTITEGSTGFSAPGIAFGTGTGQHGAIVYGGGIMYFGAENGSDNTLGVKATLNNAGVFTAEGDIRAPIYYDSNNTAFYVDPASTSVLNALTLASGSVLGSEAIFNNMNQTHTTYGDANNVGFGFRYLQSGSNYPGIPGATQYYGMTLGLGSDYAFSSFASQFYWPRSSLGGLPYPSVRFRESGTWGSWSKIYAGWADAPSGATFAATGDFRAPIFYDSNDTNYYLDPAGSSVLGLVSLFSSNDAQLRLNGNGTRWAGIQWTDDVGTDNMWFNGATSTFAIGGGGSQVANKKLHVNGGTTIGSGLASTAVSTNGLLVETRVDAPIFYDSNNTAFYLDPANFSRLATVYATGNLTTEADLIVGQGLNASYIYMKDANEGDRIIHCNSNRIGFLTQAGGWGAFCNDDGSWQMDNAALAPVYYDSNNTGYYVDPAGTSFLNTLSAREDIGSGTASAFIWTGSELFYYWTRIANVSGGDASATILITSKGDTNYVNFASALLTISAWNGATASVKLETLSGCDTTMNVRIDNNNDVWLQVHSPWSSNLSWKVINKVGSPTVYYASPTQQTATPANSVNITYGQTVRGNQGAMSSAAVDNVANTIVGGLVARREVLAPIYYDSNNTGYYVDPNSGGVALRTVGYWLADTSAWAGDIDGKIQRHNNSWYFSASNAWIFRATNGTQPFVVEQDGRAVAAADFRAPIFYDSQDTSYYCDPNGTSVLNAINAWGEIGPRRNDVQSLLRSYNTSAGQPLQFYLDHNFGNVNIGNNRGVVFAGGTYWEIANSVRSPFFYDSDNTLYFFNGAGISSAFGLAIRGDQASTSDLNQIFLWDGGGTTTSAIGFKANGGEFANPTGNGDGFNTYFTMDTPGRGWVFRRTNAGTDFTATYTSGWILNNGIWQSNGDMRAPIFYDSNNTGFYVDPTGTSIMADAVIAGRAMNSAMYYAGFTLDANTMPTNSTGFTYQNNAPYFGPVARFSTGGSYDLWLNAPYTGGAGLAFRTRDGDNATLNPWRNIAVYGQSLNASDLRATIFYDSDNTGFYVDPNGGSRMNSIQADEVYAFGWLRNNNSGNGVYNQATGQHFYSDSASGWNIAGGGGNNWLRFRDTYAGTVRGYVYADNGNSIGFLNSGGNWRARVVSGDYFLVEGSSVRAPIYYDSNDTSYYCDPNGTTVLNGLLVGGYAVLRSPGTINGNIDSNYGEGFVTFDPVPAGTPPISSPNIRTINVGNNFSRRTQLAFTYDTDRAWFRRNTDGSWGAWYEFAVFGNSASAGTLYGTVYYDGNDTGYYLDPNSTGTSFRGRGQIFLGPNSSSRYLRLGGDGGTSDHSTVSTSNGNLHIDCQSGFGLYLNWYSAGPVWSEGGAHFPIYYDRSNTAYYVDPATECVINALRADGLITGRSSASTDVNTANDTGSFSVRGSTTTVASMSFHRTGAYAINMGLGTDSVFRIGGWSASSNAFQMDGSGNLTMLGNVTAYSDARLKKDVETIEGALDLVAKMRGVRYTRIDTENRNVGVIAQEMLEVVPEVVQQGVGDDDTLSVAYGNLVGVLIEAIKELTARVAELEGK